jgi:hypothetical protein
MLRPLLVLLMVLVQYAQLATCDDAAALASSCRGKGFVLGLSCEPCKRVGEAIGPDAFRDCAACCRAPHVRAELHATQEQMYGLSGKGITDFVPHAKHFPALSVHHQRTPSKAPKLVMTQADGGKYEIPIAHWTQGQIEDYLRAHLPA